LLSAVFFILAGVILAGVVPMPFVLLNQAKTIHF
jgi:hypothetical protein